jgi:catechol 2,3-dioxygenase-like lactoylglutathione lyase family enzyme
MGGAPGPGGGLEPRITVITLAVDDLERAVAFYRDGLGWPTDGIVGTEFEDGAVAFFHHRGGPMLALWPRASLARDAGLPLGPPSATELTLGHNLASPAAVDRAFAAVIAAGGTPVKAPEATSWGGYGGYVADPDGHLWELLFNPELIPDA